MHLYWHLSMCLSSRAGISTARDENVKENREKHRAGMLSEDVGGGLKAQIQGSSLERRQESIFSDKRVSRHCDRSYRGKGRWRGNATVLGGQSQLSHVTDILVMFFYMQRLRHMKVERE